MPCFRLATQTIHSPHYRLQNSYHNTDPDPCMSIALISRPPVCRWAGVYRSHDISRLGCLVASVKQGVYERRVLRTKNAFFVHMLYYTSP